MKRLDARSAWMIIPAAVLIAFIAGAASERAGLTTAHVLEAGRLIGLEFTEAERDAMLLAGPLMAIENSVRFLADHLSGDKYYGASSPNQNLDRATAQLGLGKRLVAAIEWATTN